MSSWILTAIILAVILWCVVRAGPRRAERTLHLLARDTGGRFQRGGILNRNVAIVLRPRGEIRVRFRCISWLGLRFSAEFSAPWPGLSGASRPNVGRAAPTEIAMPGTREPRGSDQLREVSRRLQSSPAIEQNWVSVEAAGGRFLSRAVLHTADIAAVTAWFETTALLFDLMVAETETGIEFSAARPERGAGEASCQVCGGAPQPEETVFCERCGAPHHADCWNYNRGCAIYGCKK